LTHIAGSPPKPSGSGFGGERRNIGARELSAKTEAEDLEIVNAAGHAENEFNNRCDELAAAESRKYK